MKTKIEVSELTVDKFERLQESGAVASFRYNGKLRKGLLESFDEHVLTLQLVQDGERVFDVDTRISGRDGNIKSFSVNNIESTFINLESAR